MKRIPALLVILSLVVAACGGSDESTTDDSDASSTTSGESSTTTSTVLDTTTSSTIADLGITWPWSGEIVLSSDTSGDSPEATPVLIAKFSNAPQSRPQQGLEAADVAMEVVVEGGVVRILALYQSEVPDTIGPLRSAREVDPKLIEPFNASFLSSGGQSSVMGSIGAVAANASDGRIGGYFRESGRRAPYNLFLNTETARAEAEPSGVANVWYTFDDAAPTGEQALSVSVDISSFHTTTFRYSGLDDGYLRFNGEDPHETVDGDQLVASTVVVVFVDQISTGRVDGSGAPVPDYDVVGTGEAIVFRDGVAIEGSWERGRTGDFFRLFDADGDPVPLKPGQIWFEIVPNGRTVQWQ